LDVRLLCDYVIDFWFDLKLLFATLPNITEKRVQTILTSGQT